MRIFLFAFSVILSAVSIAGENASKLDEEFPRIDDNPHPIRVLHGIKDGAAIMMDVGVIVRLNSLEEWYRLSDEVEKLQRQIYREKPLPNPVWRNRVRVTLFNFGKFYLAVDAAGRLINILSLEQRDTGLIPGSVPVGAAKVLWSEFSNGSLEEPYPHADRPSRARRSTYDYKSRLTH